MWRGGPVLAEWAAQCLDRLLTYIDNQVLHAKRVVASQLNKAVLSGSR